VIKVTKGETTLVLNKLLNIKGFFVSSIKMVFVLNQVDNTAVISKSMIKTISADINKLEKILDYCGKTHLKATANDYGVIHVP
jgi:hypothetical protein